MMQGKREEEDLVGRVSLLGLAGLNCYMMQGRREEEDLQEFIARFLPERVITLWPGNYDKWIKGQTLLTYCWVLLSGGANILSG
jgi:hypothetical protein